MSEPKLNYVRCPHCGGNLADLNHPCDEDARAAAAERAVADLIGSVSIPKDRAKRDALAILAGLTADERHAVEAWCAEQARPTGLADRGQPEQEDGR